MPDILGATRDDVLAQQRTVAALLVANAAIVDAHRGLLPASDMAAFEAAAHRAAQFNSMDVSYNPFTLNDQFAQGKAVLAEMNAWAANLAKAGLTAPPPVPWTGPGTFAKPGPPVIPYVMPQESPSGSGLFSNLSADLVLAILLFLALRKS